MKKLGFFTLCAFATLLFASCNKTDYTAFVGTWGVERIVYENYNTDYQGQPIIGSMNTQTFSYDPNDINNGIQLVFRQDKTGEMRDNAVDTVWIDDDNYIVNPDTTIVRTFTYSYDKTESTLYMNMDYVHTFKMLITNLSDNAFSYENNYGMDEDNRVYYEKAYLKRISNTPAAKCHYSVKHPNKPGSFLGGR